MQNGNYIREQQIRPGNGTFPKIVGSGRQQTLIEIIYLLQLNRAEISMFCIGIYQIGNGIEITIEPDI